MGIKIKSDGLYRKFWCPACQIPHKTTIGTGGWTYNGDAVKPTFHPSILVQWGGIAKKCHSFVTDGRIQFLGDCTHELAGQTVELPDYPDENLNPETQSPGKTHNFDNI